MVNPTQYNSCVDQDLCAVPLSILQMKRYTSQYSMCFSDEAIHELIFPVCLTDEAIHKSLFPVCHTCEMIHKSVFPVCLTDDAIHKSVSLVCLKDEVIHKPVFPVSWMKWYMAVSACTCLLSPSCCSLSPPSSLSLPHSLPPLYCSCFVFVLSFLLTPSICLFLLFPFSLLCVDQIFL